MGGRTQKRTEAGTSVVQPLLDFETAGLKSDLIATARRRLGERGLPEGFKELGLADINLAAEAARKRTEDRLTRSGLTRSGPRYAAEAILEGQRGATIGDFLAQLPTLAREAEAQDLALAGQVFSTIPIGRRGESTSEAEIRESAGLGTLLGGIAARAAFAAPGGGGFSGFFKRLGSGLFGNREQETTALQHEANRPILRLPINF